MTFTEVDDPWTKGPRITNRSPAAGGSEMTFTEVGALGPKGPGHQPKPSRAVPPHGYGPADGAGAPAPLLGRITRRAASRAS